MGRLYRNTRKDKIEPYEQVICQILQQFRPLQTQAVLQAAAYAHSKFTILHSKSTTAGKGKALT